MRGEIDTKTNLNVTPQFMVPIIAALQAGYCADPEGAEHKGMRAALCAMDERLPDFCSAGFDWWQEWVIPSTSSFPHYNVKRITAAEVMSQAEYFVTLRRSSDVLW